MKKKCDNSLFFVPKFVGKIKRINHFSVKCEKKVSAIIDRAKVSARLQNVITS